MHARNLYTESIVEISSNVKQLTADCLAENGYYYEVGSNMHKFIAKMVHAGALVNPQFKHRNLNQALSKWLIVYRGDDKIACTIAWRFTHTHDFVRDFETGHAFYDAPDLRGWIRTESGQHGHVRLRGKICSRGGLKSFDSGKKLSWFTTTLAHAYALDEGYDFLVGMTFPKIQCNDMPKRYYGYAEHASCNPIAMPFMDGKEVPMTLVWNSSSQSANELDRRRTFLATTNHESLADIVTAYQAEHEADV